VAPAWPVWRERLVGVAFLGAGAAVCLFGGRLPAALQVALWAALVLALTITVSCGWLPLLGPVFVYDLVRGTRRGRYAFLRGGYALALFLFILALYRAQPALVRGTWPPAAVNMANFAETFCYTYLAVQLAAVIALTPAYVGGAVAEEKDRKTLEFLLATDIRDREIVLGKMASRVANLALLLLTGLPILSLTQLWGGVDLGLLLCAFAITGVTLLSLAALGVVASVHSRRAREAVVLTYLAAAGYAGLSVLAYLLRFSPRVLELPLTPGASPYTVSDLVDAFTAGNPGLLCLGVWEDMRTGMTLPASVAARTGSYVAFHLLVAIVCTGWAVLRLRPLALADGPVKAKAPKARRRWRLGWRPRVGRKALLWKEIWAEPGMTFNWFGKAVLLLIVLVSFVPAVWLAGDFLLRFAEHGHWLWEELGHDLNVWVRVAGTLVACLTLLGVAVRAASSISGERDRQTFDSLLTAPVESNSILFAKWVGSILSVRRAWLWLCLIWLLGSVTGGLYGPGVPWLLLSWFVYAAFLASLGLWFSMTSPTTLRATVRTLLMATILGVGHWYLWMLFCLPLRLREDVFAWVVRFQTYGLTPPFALAWLAFRGDIIESGIIGASGTDTDDPMGSFLCLVGGLVIWGLAAYVLYRRAAGHFRVLTNRVPIPVPTAGLPQPAGGSESVPAKPRPRWRRRVLVGVPVGLALLVVGWGVFRGVMADRHLMAALDEVDRADPDWHFADIEAARKEIPDDQNSAPVVLAVRGAIPRTATWPTRELVARLDDLPPEVRLSADQWRGITDDLEEVEEALLVVAPLADLSEGRYTVRWARNPMNTILPHVDARYAAQQLLWHNLMLRAEEGDPDGALTDCRRLLNLGRSLGDEPLVVSQRVRSDEARRAARGAQRVLAQGEPSEAALADLQRRLAEEETHPGFLIGARSERAQLDGLMALIQSGEVPWQELDWYVGRNQRTMRDDLDALLFSLTPGAEKESRADLLRHQSAFIEAARLPVEEQGPAFARLEAQHKELPLVARQLAWNADRINEHYRMSRAELRCAVVALAAERFRRRHGRWPERLGELVPDFLEKVPADPFGGGPLRCRRLDDGLVIYSVGPDARDDGGDVRGVPDANQVGQDLGFRLWDVSRRRQEPRRPDGAGPAAGP
jgi:ABC-type transport system involved in multi-copper enzyme maturation permease subunit